MVTDSAAVVVSSTWNQVCTISRGVPSFVTTPPFGEACKSLGLIPVIEG